MASERETEATRPAGGAGDQASIAIGAEFAGHRIEEELGRGGMGVVYRARHLALDRGRALKVIAPDLSSDERFRDRFRREARAAAAIEHPNVIEVVHAGEEGGVLYISMALVAGEDLGALIDRHGPLDAARVVGIVNALGGALDAAHDRGLLHRDVKPSNVLLERRADEEHVYLGDFGASRPAEPDAVQTATGEFFGTPDYSSPEQIEGRDADRRTDVYSLGAVAHHMLTGEPPFPRRSAPAKLVAHTVAPRPRPSNVVAGLSAAVDAVIARAMAVRPDDRFATAGELAEALERAVEQGAPPPRRARSRAKRRILAAAVALIVAAIAAGALVVTGALEGPEPETPGTEGWGGVAAIEVGEGPVSLALAEGRVWVASQGRRALAGIDPREPGAEPRLAGARTDRPRALAAGFGSLWVLDAQAGELVRLDLGPGGASAEARISLGAFPSAIAADRRWLWVANTGDDTVARIDPRTNAVDRLVPVGRRPRALALGAGSVWVASAGDGSISRIGRDQARVIGELTDVGRRPQDLAAGAGSLWVVDLIGSRLRQIDIDELTVVGRPLRVGAQPRAVALGLGRVWVANSRDGTLSRIDPATAEPVGSPIEVGDDPTDVAVGYGAVWTANFGEATVTRVEP